MSKSTTHVFLPLEANPNAKEAETVVFPTPPFPLVTATTLPLLLSFGGSTLEGCDNTKEWLAVVKERALATWRMRGACLESSDRQYKPRVAIILIAYIYWYLRLLQVKNKCCCCLIDGRVMEVRVPLPLPYGEKKEEERRKKMLILCSIFQQHLARPFGDGSLLNRNLAV